MDSYRAAATAWLQKEGLTGTTVGVDASGIDPSTTSTPSNLCDLIWLAAENPVLAQIMSTKETPFPVENKLENTNELLGQYGVFAGKTGSMDAAGRNLLTALHMDDGNGNQIVVSVAILGQPDHDTLFAAANSLLASLSKNLTSRQVVDKGEQVGTLGAGWGASVSLVAAQTLTDFGWIDQSPPSSVSITYVPLDSVPADESVGSLNIDGRAVGVQTAQALPAPPWRWRLSKAFG
jgi:D-alanyl-D-alanine carboxypeptidase (penicillin-binding protein 5/6)